MRDGDALVPSTAKSTIIRACPPAEMEGARYRSNSGTETVLELPPRLVGNCHLLRGMFAFALWDGTEINA
ncbi:hypothetical protein [Candidatus Flexifilum breve]|uniref:hypothetical protein n=1 Tax=Candidatus Flexifilum breve TaxID=3140694 RepID=UPI0031CC4215